MRRYDTVIENTELEWATAFETALMICKSIPALWSALPLQEADKDSVYRCLVRLKAKDPIEADRLSTLGERLWNGGNGSIDLMTNLTEYQGRTESAAKAIIARGLVDKLTLYNPDVASVMGMMFAEETGLDKLIEQARTRRMQMEQGGGMQEPMEQAPEGTRGARTPPRGY